MTEHPLSEMCLAIQVDQPVFTVKSAIKAHALLERFFPDVEIQGRLDKLGRGGGTPFVLSTARPDDRWWYLSQSGDFIVQYQDNLVAVNWRRREGGEDYPGFNEMLNRFLVYFAMWQEASGAEKVTPTAFHVLYDNIWGIPDDTKVADIFRFWNTLGYRGRQGGPVMNWTVQLGDDAEPITLLNEASRVDVHASLGSRELHGKTERAAKLQFAAFMYPREDKPSVTETFTTMHDKIHELLKLLVTEAKMGDFG